AGGLMAELAGRGLAPMQAALADVALAVDGDKVCVGQRAGQAASVALEPGQARGGGRVAGQRDLARDRGVQLVEPGQTVRAALELVSQRRDSNPAPGGALGRLLEARQVAAARVEHERPTAE